MSHLLAMKETIKKKVFAGVSGGVDSSVAAALLARAGYDVTGVFMRVWQPDFIECTWRDERRDAMRVCAHLGIPFLEMDLEKEYREGVAEYMIREYAAGRTPNPDVMCNREVKFGAFYAKAREMGADLIATGHYAIHEIGPHADKGLGHTLAPIRSYENKSIDSAHVLRVSRDGKKDQTYFLWAMPKDAFEHALFPVGGYTKDEVRKLAEKFGLPTATKKDSQGVCFLGQLDMKDFLAHYIPEREGTVLDMHGNEIGRHRGAVFFTLGERHGFEIAKKGADGTPLYVVAKDIEKNTITVSENPLPPADGMKQTIRLTGANWLSGAPTEGKRYQARIRYRGELHPCELSGVGDDAATLRFLDAAPLAAPGQSAVIYDGEACLGGGVIE